MDRKLIVLVEDDEDIREIIKDALCDQYSISEYENGIDCIRRLGDERGDVYLIDIMLPGMSGNEVGERIFQQYTDVSIVYMSGKDDFKLNIKHPPDSKIYFISKPFEIKTIRLLIKCIIDPNHPDCKDCPKEDCPLRIE